MLRAQQKYRCVNCPTFYVSKTFTRHGGTEVRGMNDSADQVSRNLADHLETPASIPIGAKNYLYSALKVSKESILQMKIKNKILPWTGISLIMLLIPPTCISPIMLPIPTGRIPQTIISSWAFPDYWRESYIGKNRYSRSVRVGGNTIYKPGGKLEI